MKKIKGNVKDLLSSFRVTSSYKKAIAAASDEPSFADPINALAKKLHPGFITLRLDKRVCVAPGCYYLTFSGVDTPIPLFKPGQFLTLTKWIGSSVLTRAYTIASDCKKRETVSVLIKKMGGPFTDYLESCPIGETFSAEIGLGQFYYEPLRDSKNLVILVGGSGVTPAISMAYAAKDYHLTILFGVDFEEQIVLRDELEALVGENVSLVYFVRDGGKTVPCEKGLITAEGIRKYMGQDPTFFVCGPKPMIDSMVGELMKLDIPQRRLHIEGPSLQGFPGHMEESEKAVFHLSLHIGKSVTVIEARNDESLLTSFERAGILVHNRCRSGACGCCRVKVLSGDYRYLPSRDGRREGDKEMNYVHACCTFPCSDMELLLDIPRVL